MFDRVFAPVLTFCVLIAGTAAMVLAALEPAAPPPTDTAAPPTPVGQQVAAAG